MVSASPSPSEDPLSMLAAAVPPAPARTLTFFARAMGTWFGVAQAPAQSPVTASVYVVPVPPPGSTSCTTTEPDCPPPAPMGNENGVAGSELNPGSDA